jgi:hypothetical protein
LYTSLAKYLYIADADSLHKAIYTTNRRYCMSEIIVVSSLINIEDIEKCLIRVNNLSYMQTYVLCLPVSCVMSLFAKAIEFLFELHGTL